MDVFAGIMTALWAAYLADRLSPAIDAALGLRQVTPQPGVFTKEP
jgi:hypothetical protein